MKNKKAKQMIKDKLRFLENNALDSGDYYHYNTICDRRIAFNSGWIDIAGIASLTGKQMGKAK